MTIKKFVVAAGAALVACAVPISTVGESPRQRAAPPPDSEAVGDARFEGYLFRDNDGNPLPFQSDADIEDFLAHAVVVSTEKIPVGVTSPRKLLLARGPVRATAAFKQIDRNEQHVRTRAGGRQQLYLKWRDWYGYDIASYRVDRLLGLNRVPPTVERKIKRNWGSVSIWIKGAITERDRQQRGIDPPDAARFSQQMQTLRLFDNLVANSDSNLGNALIDGNWRIWFIDCSRCFGSSTKLLYPEAVTQVDRAVLQALRNLDRERADEVLSDYLSCHEIDALFERRDKLITYIDALIADRGEEVVVFDKWPATERAPWADD